MTRLHVIGNYVMAIEKGISDDIINIIKSNKTTDDNVREINKRQKVLPSSTSPTGAKEGEEEQRAQG